METQVRNSPVARKPEAAGDTVPAQFLRTAEQYADQTALRYKHHGLWHDVTWSEYRDRVHALVLALRDLGFEKGDRVAILGDNCPEWVTIDLAVQSAGGITVGIYSTNAPE